MTSGGFGVNTALTIPLMVLTASRADWLSLVIVWSDRRLKVLIRLFTSLRIIDSRCPMAVTRLFSSVLLDFGRFSDVLVPGRAPQPVHRDETGYSVRLPDLRHVYKRQLHPRSSPYPQTVFPD